ncbi:CehA/McbA family metallohydrolase [Paenibacillus sp. 1011MAR3C5]|uniref:CehA/McbA family metallohydrolase n=1 Tax=Paenibacillus sp. 1011MAR3C5 TaxID=1675787 RepID=UPI00217598CD|nr:CehA/McbA family metallohydrolase [Paenibacillus sp. 1011MAR3C5]
MKSNSRNLPLIVMVCLIAGVASLCYGIMVSASSEKEEVVSNKDRAEYLGSSLFKGHMHSHTSLSDGVLLPNDAYNFVKANTDFDFFAVTEHDVTYDISTGSDFITNVQDSYSEEYKLLHEQSDAHNHDNEFITLPGTEVTWYDEAGHINLFNAPWFARTHGVGADGTWGWSDIKYDLPTFYARLAQDPDAIAQFNHPRSSGNWSFNEFRHYNRDVDRNLNMMEYKSSNDFAIYTKALDRGWHVSPVFGGDEHKGNWGMVQPHVTGMWGDHLTREGLYEAMRNHRTYVSFDRHLEMAVSANGQMMGAILPADTHAIDLYVRIIDPDPNDHLDKVVVYKNSGEIVKEYRNIASNSFEIEETFASADGDYFIVRAFQGDGEEAVSAPIWIGEETRGTVHAPEITVHGQYPDTVELGDQVEVRGASATDNSGQSIPVEAIVLNDKGEAAVLDQHFKVEMYGEYFIKYVATDNQGNTRVELIRLLVDQQNLDADNILNEFQPIVNVGANEREVGINVVTDKALETAYIQYKPESEASWDYAEAVQAEASYFQVAYGDTFAKSNYRVLAAHEANITDLALGTKYDYRYGMSPAGPWSGSYSFRTAPASGDAVMYVMGDLEVPDRNPASFQLYKDMLDVLREKNGNGQTVIQVGDLAWLGGNRYAWDDVFNNIYNNSLDLISAHIAGDRERVTERKFGAFSGFFNLPKNGEGSYRETNYSFDYGDMHIAVLNSVLDFDKQLSWLEKDMRATDKKWKIVMGHYPYYGGQSGDETGMNIMRVKLSQAFERLGVSLYIGGHDHVYKRTTIRNGLKDISEDAMNLGTTFVTVGSSGPTFYDNKTFDWDHIVYDENKQTGVILESNDQSLTLKAYNSDGVEVDSFTIEQPENYLNLTSAIVENNVLKGVGVLNYPNSVERVTVIAEKRDHTGEQVLGTVIQEATLEHLGREQIILLDSPLAFGDEHMILVRLVNNPVDREPLTDALIAKEGMLGEGSEDNPYQIKSVEGLYKMHEFPDKHYVLERDIDGRGVFFEAIGANETPFTGTFDGQGHTITGVIVSSGGAGLFAINEGTIRNVGIIHADIDVRRSNVGILVDQNDGIVEYVYSTGSIKGNSTVGGLVGYLNGTVKNSYSTARVHARGKQAGGIIGITNRGSVTEQVYAMGAVIAEESNAGGISGYGYNNTVIQNSMALNPSVVTGTASNRIVGRVLAGDTATLVNNYADENMFVSSENVTVNDPNNEKGQGVGTEAFTQSSFFAETLGWDFDSIWIWNEDAKRPLLQSNVEQINEDHIPKPKLDRNEDGYYIIRSISELKTISEFPNENYIVENDLDFEGKLFEPLFMGTPFLGIFDGNHKSLTHFNSENGGLFHLNGGTIKNIAMVDASVTGGSNIGILVNTNNGKIENSYTTGSIAGSSTVGGLAGYSNGIVRNSYSTADVTAQLNQAGGLIGITNSGSLTENVYASGAVQALRSNAGGVTGYAYNDTVVRNVIALNPSVVTPTMANRVVGRVLAGHTATLENNYAFDGMLVDKEGESVGAADNRKGLGLSQLQVEDSNTYTDRLKWDFESVWMWSVALKRPVLSSNPEEAGEPAVPLERDEAGYYKIKSIADLSVMEDFPSEKYRLDQDLDFDGQMAESLFKVVSFTGVFDGDGKKIYHFNSSSGGLFHLNGGVIKNIAMIDASATGGSRIGILVNTNNGELENSLSTGSITGSSTVGGLVGYSNGIVRNSYSTADVTAQVSQAGGLIGITNAGSLTENVYASGTVRAITSNAGGVTGYGYNDTAVRNVIALGPSVTAPTMANRVMGRVLAGHTATLENNYAFDGMIVDKEGVAEGTLTTLKGLGLSASDVEDPSTYTDQLGWDFNDIWRWDIMAKRPVLQAVSEGDEEEPVSLIALELEGLLTLVVGESDQTTTAAVYSDGSRELVETNVAYASSDPNIAEISASGAVTAKSEGTVLITAEYEGLISSYELIVIKKDEPDKKLIRLELSGSDPRMQVHAALNLTLIAIYEDGTRHTISEGATYTSSKPQTASVSEYGVVTAHRPGAVTIIASYQGQTASYKVRINAAGGIPFTP